MEGFEMERFTKLMLLVFSIILLSSTLAFSEEPVAPPGGGAGGEAVTSQAEEAPAAAPAEVQAAAPAPAWDAKFAADTVWVLVTAFLVFFMNLGFAMVESGLCRAKNAVNILSKNFIVFAISSLAFYIIGWGLMFGDGTGLLGLKGLWFVSGADNSPAMGDAYQGVYGAINWTGVPIWAKFF